MTNTNKQKKTLRGRVYADQFQTTFIPKTGSVGIDIKTLASVMGLELDGDSSYEITIEQKTPKSGATVIIDENSFLNREKSR